MKQLTLDFKSLPAQSQKTQEPGTEENIEVS